jgi:hypothetical protein
MLNMRQLLFVFISTFFVSPQLFSQIFATEKSYSVQGFITNKSGNTIENVHVVNISMNKGTTTNMEGQFNMGANLGDTIRFTCVGYLPAKYYVPHYSESPVIPLHVIMSIDTVQISGVNIYPWPSDAYALKKAILAMDNQTPEQPDLKLNDFSYKPEGLPHGALKPNIPGMADPGLTYTIPGPITALYDAFSKTGKSKRKLSSLENADQQKVIAARRYNAEVVRRVTAFTSDKEIQDFMLFCNLTIDFIVSSSEYELYTAIHNCLLAYNAEHESK